MSRPFVIPSWLHYTCQGCGACCRRGYAILCPSQDYARFSAIDWKQKYPQLAEGPLWYSTPQGMRFALTEEGACRFLTPDNRCLIHAELGFHAKALTCKIYPYQLVHSAGRVYVGLLFSCPHVVADTGEAVSRQEPLLRTLLHELDRLFPPPPCETTFLFTKDHRIGDEELTRLEARLLDIFEDTSLPWIRRVFWAGEILDRLEGCSPADLSGRNFATTLSFQIEKAREHAEYDGMAPLSLGFFEGILFRQFVGMCASLAEKGLTSSFFGVRQRARLKRIRLALAYMRGKGRIPGEKGITFADVREVKAHVLPAESEALLSRYLRTRLASRSYFGPAGWRMTVLEGARFTLFLSALVIQHAKIYAARRGRKAIDATDLAEAVALVDHTFGHTPTLRVPGIHHALSFVNRPRWPQRAIQSVMLP